MIKVTTSTTVPRDFLADMQRKMRSAIVQLIGVALKEAVIQAPANTGLLRNSIHIFRKKPLPRFEGGIITNLPYAILMEEGVLPGAFKMKTISIKIPLAPYRALVKFAEEKMGLSGDKAVSVAFAIAWKGHRSGRWPKLKTVQRQIPDVDYGALGSWVRRKHGVSGDEARNRTFAVAHGLVKKGIPGNPRFDNRGFFRKAKIAAEESAPGILATLGLEIQGSWEKGR